MTRLKLVSLALVVVAATVLATGTAGFSSASADRGVSVSVVSDDRAMVDVEACYMSANRTTVQVRVTNQLPSDLTVVHVEGEPPQSGVATVQPGEAVVVTRALDTSVDSVIVGLESDGGTSVTLTRGVVETTACPFSTGDGGETGATDTTTANESAFEDRPPAAAPPAQGRS